MILIQNFYLNNHREDEILFCLEQNNKNDLVTKIILFIDPDLNLPIKYRNNKLYYIIRSRPTFYEMFKYVNGMIDNTLIELSENNVFILANTDIFFDNTLNYLNTYDKWGGNVMALTRWEFDGNKHSRYIGWDYSQDVWVWRGKLNLEGMECDFPMGKPGCDNRLAFELSKNYNVINPCKTIRCHHYHLDRYRGYTPGDPKETIPEPYLRVEPIEL
jgi:sulfite reductase alpha subunit-like flavoprotein